MYVCMYMCAYFVLFVCLNIWKFVSMHVYANTHTHRWLTDHHRSFRSPFKGTEYFHVDYLPIPFLSFILTIIENVIFFAVHSCERNDGRIVVQSNGPVHSQSEFFQQAMFPLHCILLRCCANRSGKCGRGASGEHCFLLVGDVLGFEDIRLVLAVAQRDDLLQNFVGVQLEQIRLYDVRLDWIGNGMNCHVTRGWKRNEYARNCYKVAKQVSNDPNLIFEFKPLHVAGMLCWCEVRCICKWTDALSQMLCSRTFVAANGLSNKCSRESLFSVRNRTLQMPFEVSCCVWGRCLVVIWLNCLQKMASGADTQTDKYLHVCSHTQWALVSARFEYIKLGACN